MATTRHQMGWQIQKAGHASITDTGDGRWYMVHLCGRPVGEKRRCILGRETSLQEVMWTEDGWLRLRMELTDRQ